MIQTRAAAYSLYELLITLLLVSLTFGLGVPSFARIAADQRLRAQLDPLFHAVHRARKSSITRRQVVTLCPSEDGSDCSDAADWSRGWILFVNADRDFPARRDDDEALLAVHRGDPRVRITANRRSFTLRGTGLRATNGTLVVCDRAGRARPRALVISYTGRPRVAREDTAGRAYRCST